MAGRGPAPKPADQRRRRNADPVAAIPLSDDGKKRGPTLRALTGTSAWADQTIAWYETWRSSPQAQVFLGTDWRRLALLAPAVESYFARPSAALLSEIRLNEERLGATVVDRQRARMVVQLDDEEPGATLHALPSSATSSRDAIRERLKR